MSIPALSDQKIRNWIDSRSYQRGKKYHQQNAILYPQREDSTLKALCLGSTPSPYRLWVTVGKEGVVAGECSCPVGKSGRCKHVAALLLAWLHQPERFEDVASLKDTLATWDKEDLIALIHKMVERHPELLDLINLMSTTGGGQTEPISPQFIRRQVKRAMETHDHGHDSYGAASDIANDIHLIMDQADRYKGLEDWQNAAVIYRAVLAELIEQYDQIYDHDGDLFTIFYRGGEQLGTYLEHIEQEEIRRGILQTLLDVIVADIEIGGYGFNHDAYNALRKQATPQEKAALAEEVEKRLGPSVENSDFTSKWRANAYGGLILELKKDTLDDAEFLRLCRRSGRWQDLVERLLKLDRKQEAITVTKNVNSDYDLLQLADIFHAQGHEQSAEDLVWERAGRSDDRRLEQWLKERAREKGNWTTAVKYAEKQFRQRPSLSGYEEVSQIAKEIGDWEDRRQQILKRLGDAGNYHLLTEIHLAEDNTTAALETIGHVKSTFWSHGDDLRVAVARAAEESHPQQALNLYKKRITTLIDQRGRDNYATAAKHLQRVKAIYQRLGEDESWQTYIAEVRNQKPRLPALLDELKEAGL